VEVGLAALFGAVAAAVVKSAMAVVAVEVAVVV